MKNTFRLSERMKRVYTILFVGFLTVVVVSLAFNKSIWLDEGFSLRWSMLPTEAFVKRITLDVCPLYLIMLRFVLTITGGNLIAAKLFSATAIVLIFILIGAIFIRKEFGLKSMTFLGLFLICMPMIMNRAVEIRMYSWAFLWILLSCSQMYYLIGKNTERKNWILFTLFSLAGAYTHYFCVLTLVVIYVGMLVYFLFSRNVKKIKAWMICAIVTVLGYLPWVPVILQQTKSETTSWIPNQTSIWNVLRTMFCTNIPRSDKIFLLIIALFCLFGVILFIKYKTVELYWSLVCMSALWLVWIFGLIFEACARPILTSKYLSIPLCATIVGMSSLCKYINKYIWIGLCALCLVFGFDVYHTVYTQEYGTKVNETLQFAEEHFKDGDIIISDAGSLCSVIPYYFPNSRQIDDVYRSAYDYLWYFDTGELLDMEQLQNNDIAYIDYGNYGFDVAFEILYLYRKSK